jgi:chemosensory pili system protein ChpA (sensor histidine kinase/response regulator)
MMAESVNDVTTVQQGLLHNLDGAELALGSQARMARELQQGLMQVRMLPFDSLASRLYRVVRQSARELGKRATLDLRGGRIEVDRSVLEQMAAPLEHLLRNAVAHGIELPAERSATGKAETGSIVLTVNQEGNEIALTIADDGAGLDLDRIATQARARGLLGTDESADERRLTNMIFVSGFSTAREVSAVSGRGVGMDVVKAQTAAAGGRIEVTSRRGAGTRFALRLPLTLAVTQALLVQAGGRSWAVPVEHDRAGHGAQARRAARDAATRTASNGRASIIPTAICRACSAIARRAPPRRATAGCCCCAPARRRSRCMSTGCAATRKSSSRTPARSSPASSA